MKNKQEPLTIWAAKLAAKFAQLFGLAAGNLWEPGIARHLALQVNSGMDRDTAQMLFASRMGVNLCVRDAITKTKTASLKGTS